jgi:hypothetical protein
MIIAGLGIPAGATALAIAPAFADPHPPLEDEHRQSGNMQVPRLWLGMKGLFTKVSGAA